MGLDMYLKRRWYVQQWAHQNDEDKFQVTVTQGGEPFIAIDPARVSYVWEQVGYWRKANAIHKWFVDNVQGKTDDCKDYSVSIDQMKQLLTDVNTVLDRVTLVAGKVHNGTVYKNGKAEEIYEDGMVISNPEVCEAVLPCSSGFFFGGLGYDQWYLEDLKLTKNILETCIAEYEAIPDLNQYRVDYFYQSSW